MRLRKRSPCLASTPRMRSTSMMSQPSPIRVPPGGRRMLMILKPRNTRNAPKKKGLESCFRVSGVFRGGRFSWIHERLHRAHSLVDPAEQRTANDAVADVEFMQVRDGADLRDVDVIDAMAGVDDQPGGVRLLRTLDDALDPTRASVAVSGVALGPGGQLGPRRLQIGPKLDLLRLGVDEEARLDARGDHGVGDAR